MNKIVNSFVYQRILESGMPNPNIPAYLTATYSQCYEDIIVEGLLRAYVAIHGSPNQLPLLKLAPIIRYAQVAVICYEKNMIFKHS